MLIIKRIDEADYGCEERLPGEPLKVLVTLASENGDEYQFECADNYLISMGLDEGDEWPQDEEEIEAEVGKLESMSKWMDNYLDALEELDDN